MLGEMAQMLLCALLPGLDRFVCPSRTLWEPLLMGEVTPHILHLFMEQAVSAVPVLFVL